MNSFHKQSLNQHINEESTPSLAQNYSSNCKKCYTRNTRNLQLMFSKLLFLSEKWIFSSKDFQTKNQQLNGLSLQQAPAQGHKECDSKVAYRKWQSYWCDGSQYERDLGEDKLSALPSFPNSHFLAKQSICFYAASSVILALCIFTIPASALIENRSHPV